METKGRKASILLSVLALLFLPPAVFAQNVFHFDNIQGITSAFLVPGGRYVHKVILTFSTTSSTTPAFSIKADADTPQSISPGSGISYHGKTVTMTGGSGSYSVSIEMPTPSAYFSSNENWSLTVSGLSTSSTTSAIAVSSQDISSAALNPDPTYFRYGWTWTGNTNIPALLKIPADGVVDDALLYVRIVKQASAPNPSFVIKPNGQNQTILVAPGTTRDTSPPLDDGAGEVYKLTLLSAISSGSTYTNVYRLELRNDTNTGFPPPPLGNAEEWILLVQDGTLGSNDSIELFAASRNAGAANYTGTEAVSTDIVNLNQPPRPQITSPGINPCSIVKGRNSVFTSVHGDLEAASLAYSWNIKSATSNDNFSTLQNPTENPFTTLAGHAYDSYADYTVSLTVTETLATGLAGTVPTISQSSTTVLAATLSPEEKIGFPRYLALPYYPNPPLIDGYISDALGTNPVDAAWRAASRYTMVNGAATAHVAFQGMKSSTGDALYMSFEVRNDDTLDAEDALVLAFRPDYSSTDASINTTAFRNNDVVMIIYPFANSSGAPTGAAPNKVEIWRYNGSSWDDVSSTYTSWVIADRSFDFNSKKAWDMELKLPIGTSPMAINDQFYFYYNVLRVSSSAPGVTQFFWPRDSKNLGVVLRPTSVFAGSWGKADKTSGVALDGVWCDWNAVSVTPPNPNYPADDFWITYNDSTPVENTFTTTVKNDRQQTTDTGTTYIASPGVIVLLRMANWGIGGANPGPDWQELDALFPNTTAGSNPSAAQPVPAAAGPGSPGIATFVYGTNVGPTASLPPNISSQHHQCIYIELNAEQDVYIKSKGTYRNMNFAHASELSREATISVRGFGPAPKGRTTFRYLLVTSQKAIAVKDDSRGPDHGPGPVGMGAAPPDSVSIDPSYLTWEVNGYLCTGNSIVIRGKPFEILNATGSFGYVVEHDAEVASWDPQIEGARLEGDGSYSLEIPAESAVTIRTVITPKEFTPFALSLHAGAAFPLASFGNSYSMGFGGILDAQWAFSNALSLVLMAGYNYLPGASSVVLPTSIINLALDFRYTLPVNPTLFAYAQAGPNFYIQDFSTTAFGMNVGLGVGYILSPRFRLEAGADVHSTIALQNWLLQTHIGVVMRL